MTDDGEDSASGRNKGRVITATDNGSHELPVVQREGRTIPVPDLPTHDIPPDSITGEGGKLEELTVHPEFRLKPLPLKGLKGFVYSASVLLIIYFAIEFYHTTINLWNDHWLLATAFLILIATVMIFGLRATFDYLKGGDPLGKLDEIKDLSDRMRYSRDKGSADELVVHLTEFYAGKPQKKLLDECMDQLEDYFDDSEVLSYIEKGFLENLDREAINMISQNCLYTGTAIAISPWAAMDVGLALWRNVKLLEGVSTIYGIRPSLRNRVRLFKMVIGKMAFVGSSQALINSAVEGVSSLGVGVPLLASFAQGLGAGVYTGKIGIAAMEASRPIAFEKCAGPRLSDIISPTIDELKANMLKVAGVEK